MSDEDDSPRTVFAPDPGGRRSAAKRAQQASPELGLGPVSGSGDVEIPPHGVNPLVDAASEVLELAVYLRGQTTPLDIETLRQKMLVLVKSFERRALANGEPAKVATVARYAVAATLDDVMLSSPWGYDAGWQRKTLVAELHGEVYGGDKFFELLETAKRDPQRFKNLIELMYVCLSLGFRGRYWREKERVAELDETRADVHRTIDDLRGGITDALSVRWRGVETTRKTLRQFLPTWLIGALGAAVAAALFFVATLGVNEQSSLAIESANAMPPEKVALVRFEPPDVVPPPLPEPPAPIIETGDKFRAFLETEIDEGLVVVDELSNATLVRIKTVANDGEAMFASGKAAVQPRYHDALRRVATAMAEENGTVFVIGYTDNIPIRTARFPSNFELSLARAEATAEMMRSYFADPNRLRVEGRGERDPIETNATAEGRALNRRIELVLLNEPGEAAQ